MSMDARLSPRQESKISLFVMRAARRQSWTAGRFRASSEMIKHYDRFIGGHDSTVNHRRKRAMAREAMRVPLTTRCHSRTPDRLDADRLRWKLNFSPVLLRVSERDDFHDIHDTRARSRFARASSCEPEFSRLSL